MKSNAFKIAVVFGCGLSLCLPESAPAFQSHAGYEGLVGHQLAHVFFAAAMGILAYWLHVNRFAELKGWRFVQISCFLFIAWNLDAMFGHWVEERIPDNSLIGEPDWTQRLYFNVKWAFAYYMLKMDHLLCVPAMICLAVGIRLLLRSALEEQGRNG